ncbi:MAG TPA: hypothetical protein VFO20_10830 [Propionibacteriaceae bacterium]|nr:hypothetical protein [Propionibacteriaceae bacterium]
MTWLLGIRMADHQRAESPSGTPNLLELLCVWLDEVWHIGIPKDREDMTMHYASRPYRLPAGSLSGAVVVDPRPAHPYRCLKPPPSGGSSAINSWQILDDTCDTASPPR